METPKNVIQMWNNEGRIKKVLTTMNRPYATNTALVDLNSAKGFLADSRWRLLFASRSETVSPEHKEEIELVSMQIELLRARIAGIVTELEHDGR